MHWTRSPSAKDHVTAFEARSTHFQRIVAEIQNVDEVCVPKSFGMDHADGIGDQRDPMDVFDVTQSERIQLDELGIGFDAKVAQTRQMTKGMRSNRDKASINNRQMSKMMKTLEKK